MGYDRAVYMISNEHFDLKRDLMRYATTIKFAFCYAMIFYFLGHLDALFSRPDFKHSAGLLVFYKDDYYFLVLTFLLFFMFFTLYYVFKLGRKRELTMREFIFFTVSSTIILPISVWGAAWSQWVVLKDTGSLTLWKIGLLHISVLWKHYVPLHIAMTIAFLILVIGLIVHKNRQLITKKLHLK